MRRRWRDRGSGDSGSVSGSDSISSRRAAGRSPGPFRSSRSERGQARRQRLDAARRRFDATISRKSLPGVNQGRSRAGTTIGVSGFRGLRAIRRFRRLRSNVPKPTSDTRSPRDTASRTTSIDASIARPTSALLAPVRLETSATNPFLFTIHPQGLDIFTVRTRPVGGQFPPWRATILLMHKVPLRAAFLTVLGLLAACSNDPGRDFARYYDGEGLFTLNLPAANTVTVTQPQSGQDGPDLLTGVVSSPPAPSPSPASAFGGGFAG